MNKKVSFSQAPAYLTKVKKDVTKGASKSHRTEAIQEKRHEKINFKQYLRDLQESQSSINDEFQHIHLYHPSQAIKEGLSGLRVLHFGGAYEYTLAIREEDWEVMADLQLDESMTVYTDYDERWYVTRSPSNHLVFECHELNFDAKFEFNAIIKRLR